MFEQLIEAISTFSFRSVLRTNIISSPGSSFGSAYSSMSMGNGLGNNSPARSLSNSRLLSSFYLKLQELTDYEISELSNTTLSIFEDYLTNYFNEKSDLIQLSEDVKNYELAQARLNKVFKQIDLLGEVKSNLRPYMYYGSYSFKIAWDEVEQKYVKYKLANPTSVVAVDRGGSAIPESYLVVSKEGTIYQVSPYSIINFRLPGLSLYNDLNEDFFSDNKEDTLIDDINLIGGYPLYFNISDKVKEYLLKDKIISLLSIKDLIQPLLLLLRVDNNTSPDEANKLALNVENLINKYSDVSSLMGTNFSITDLVESLVNNIRVLPDYLSGFGDMNNLDLSKITNKIQEIRGDQDNIKESILNGLAIPRSLYSGDSTKWDAIKSSQRLNSKINYYIKNLNTGIEDAAIMLHKAMTGEDLTRDQITVHLFKKTDADYNAEITNADIVNQIMDQILRIIDTIPRTLRDNELVDPDAFCKYVKDKLVSIDADIENFITEDNINKYVKSVIESRSQKDSPSGGYGGFGGGY